MRYSFFILSIILFCLACKPQQSLVNKEAAKDYATFVLEEALMTCFPEGVEFDNGKPYNCEFSAVAVMGDDLVFGNDKNTSKTSNVVLGNAELLKEGKMKNPRTVDEKPLYNMRKIEDFAFTPDGEMMFLTSGFDRLKKGDNSWDAYNCLLAWDIKENNFQMIGGVEDGGIMSSKEYRYQFLKILRSEHMKIEGLMVLPGNRLVFGVREMGEHFENPTYTSTFIECTYKKNDDEILITSPFKIKYRLDTAPARKDLGLSSMYFDNEKQMIYVTSSYEAGEEGKQELGGFIWSISLADYEEGKQATLIKDKNNQAFKLRHKVEGITKMKDGNYFIMYDNDRTDIPVRLNNGTSVSRQKNQGVYSIVTLP